MRRRLAAALLELALPAMALPAFAADHLIATKAWARATPPGTTVAAAYVSIEGGTVADRLVTARVEGAGRVEFHEVRDESGLSRMRQLAAVEVPARSRVAFAPGGLHLMLLGLERPLVAGELRTLTLEFQHAGRLDVELHVRSATAADYDGSR